MILALVLWASMQECPAPQPLPVEVVKIPMADIDRAKDKLRLIKLLVDSLRDEGKGIVNEKREIEIQQLLRRLKEAR
jgi:hypothetical protein